MTQMYIQMKINEIIRVFSSKFPVLFFFNQGNVIVVKYAKVQKRNQLRVTS